jgi:hypothetical protein
MFLEEILTIVRMQYFLFKKKKTKVKEEEKKFTDRCAWSVVTVAKI